MVMKKLLVLLAAIMPLSIACAATSTDQALIRPDARNVEKLSFPESNSRQISYTVNLKYPDTALTNVHFEQLRKLGWSKCSASREGWDSYVDSSRGEGRERSVFQNISYWYKGNTLLTVSMMYYASVTKDKRCLDVPDNTQQRVIVLEHSGPGVKEGLGITCP
jgi:hypothetical protein